MKLRAKASHFLYVRNELGSAACEEDLALGRNPTYSIRKVSLVYSETRPQPSVVLVWSAKCRVFNDTNAYMILKLMSRGRNAEQQVSLFCKF